MASNLSYIPTEFGRNWVQASSQARRGVHLPNSYIDIVEGNRIEATIFAQIMYWHEPSKDTGKRKLDRTKYGHYWLTKPHAKWWEETRIKYNTVRTYLKRLEKRGLIYTQLHGENGKATTWIRVNWQEFEARIRIWMENSFAEKSESQCEKDYELMRIGCHDEPDGTAMEYSVEYKYETLPGMKNDGQDWLDVMTKQRKQNKSTLIQNIADPDTEYQGGDTECQPPPIQNVNSNKETTSKITSKTKDRKDSPLREHDTFLRAMIYSGFLNSSFQAKQDIPDTVINGELEEPQEILDNSIVQESESPQETERTDSEESDSKIVHEAEKLLNESKKLFNNQYQEVVRRAFALPGQPLSTGAFVGDKIKFLCGKWKDDEKNAGPKKLNYQLKDTPMLPAEIAGMTIWYRNQYKQNKLPSTLSTLRERCDEFRALYDYSKYVAEGQRRLNAIMSNPDSEPIEEKTYHYDNTRPPTDEDYAVPDSANIEFDESLLDAMIAEGKNR